MSPAVHIAPQRYLRELDDDHAAGAFGDVILGLPRSPRSFAHRLAAVFRLSTATDALVVDHRPEHGTASLIVDDRRGEGEDAEILGAGAELVRSALGLRKLSVLLFPGISSRLQREWLAAHGVWEASLVNRHATVGGRCAEQHHALGGRAASWRPTAHNGDGAAGQFPRVVRGASVALRPLELVEVETMFMTETDGGTRWSPVLGGDQMSLSHYQRTVAALDHSQFALFQAGSPIGRAYLTEIDHVARHASCGLSIGPAHRAPRTILDAAVVFGCEVFRTSLLDKLYFDTGVSVSSSTLRFMDQLLDDEGHKREEFLRHGELVDRRICSISRSAAFDLVDPARSSLEAILDLVGIG